MGCGKYQFCVWPDLSVILVGRRPGLPIRVFLLALLVSALAYVDLSLIGLAWVVVVFGVPCVLAPVSRIPLREEFVRKEEELEEKTV